MDQTLQKELDVSVKHGRYYKAYELILKLEHEVRMAKCSLLRGESPYVELGICERLAAQAQTEWHMERHKELEEHAQD